MNISVSRRSITGRQVAALAALIVAMVPAFVLAWRSRHFQHLGYFHDDGMYWIAGKSLAEGKGYRILNLPGAPYQTKYPPVLPLLLSMVWKAFPEFPANLSWAMLLAAAMLPAFAWVNVRLLESWGCRRDAAMLICAWIVLNPYIVLFSVNLMPELLLTTVLGCCLLCAQKAAQKNSSRIALAAGFLGGLACLIKAAAMPLLAAGPIWFALRRKFRLALWFAAPLLVLVFAWNAWSARHIVPSTDSVIIYYTSYLGDFLHDLRRLEWVTFFWKNVPVFITSVGNLLIPNIEGLPLFVQRVSTLIGLIALIGVLRQMRSDGVGLQHWFAAGYSILLLVWQYPPNERFLIPILPVFVYGAQAELRHVAVLVNAGWRSGKSDQRVASGIFALLLAAVFLWAGAALVTEHYLLLPAINSRYGAQLEGNHEIYEWVNHNVAPAEPILTNLDVAAFLYTGHPALRLPNFPKQYYRQDREAVRRAYAELPIFAHSHGIHYLLLSQTDLDLDPFVKSIIDWNKLTSGPQYRLLLKAPMAELYRIETPR